jgi:hypothetical protein
MKTPELEKKLDLIELSDAFRRHASFENQQDMKALVKKAREFAVLTTHYFGEYPALPENRKNDENLRRCVLEIADMARVLKIDSVVLPCADGPDSWVAGRINDEVLRDLDLRVKFSLQKEAYGIDFSSLGPIDADIPTALDEGVRGIMKIEPEILRTWDL